MLQLTGNRFLVNINFSSLKARKKKKTQKHKRTYNNNLVYPLLNILLFRRIRVFVLVCHNTISVLHAEDTLVPTYYNASPFASCILIACDIHH